MSEYINKADILGFIRKMESSRFLKNDSIITDTVLSTTECIKKFVSTMPSADVQPVVHCPKCEYWDERLIRCNKHKDSMMYGVHDFCSKGKQKGADNVD